MSEKCGNDKGRCCVHHGSGFGVVWVAGWLFTIGYLDLAFWPGVKALFLWAYYLGKALAATPVVAG